ncbi:MAG: molybdopterin-dependent oxidoreductase [Proteobacteria bacterium]|nr:molybdopterin-dependent oxidoreductase [Pseudomonadota bacterium]
MGTNGNRTTIRTVCALHDGFACGMVAYVENGVITKTAPADFPNPSDRGICRKGLATPELVYHPNRLRHPLKRTGKRGEGGWERVSWEEALDGIANKLQQIASLYGSTSMTWVNTMPNLQGAGYSRLASLMKGTWVDVMGFGDAAGPCADIASFGRPLGEAHLSSIRDPEFGIVWGYNPAFTDHRRMRRIMKDKANGCRLVTIDPRVTATASYCDEHILIRPGTDGALALAMIHVILKEGMQDESFIAANTVGPLLIRNDNGLFLRDSDVNEGGSDQRFMVYDENTARVQPSDGPSVSPALLGVYAFAGTECRPAYQLLLDMAQEYTPRTVSQITDVPTDTIRNLAITYATEKPACIHRGWGLQRSFHADLTCRAINTLASITGNINLNRPATFSLNRRSLFMPAGPYNRIPILALYDTITKGAPLTIKGIWFAAQNFLNQLPNANRIVNELFPELELIVVSDFFMTATAEYADFVLPAATFLECIDLHIMYADDTCLQLQQKVIEPLPECKSDFQIAAELGRRLGFGDYFDKTEEQYLEEFLTSGHPTMEGVSLARLKEGPVPAKGPSRPPHFRTPTGRIEFYVERLRQNGQTLPIYIDPVETGNSDKAQTYPLCLLSTHPKYRLHSVMSRIPSLLKLDPEPFLEINPADAESRGIRDGDMVRVHNARGQVKLKAKLSSHIKPSVIDIPQGWHPDQYIDGHHNQLTQEEINPAQQFIMEPNAALYDVLVDVTRSEKYDT